MNDSKTPKLDERNFGILAHVQPIDGTPLADAINMIIGQVIAKSNTEVTYISGDNAKLQ